MYRVMGLDGSIDDGYADVEINTIKYVRTYKYQRDKMSVNVSKKINPRIQIIGIDITKNVESIFDFINKTFDFNICKNMYRYDGKDHIRAYDFGEIFLKETKFEIPNSIQRDVQSNVDRYCKYNERGIKFKNRPCSDNMSHFKLDEKYMEILSKHIKDSEKWDVIYQLRGSIEKIKKIDTAMQRMLDYKQEKCSHEKCAMKFVANDSIHKHLTIYGWNTWPCDQQEFAIFDKKID
jgi:hypothetical protein